MPRPIDRTRLRTELLTAGRVLTEPLRGGLTEAHRLGALDILLQRIAYEAGLPEVADEIATMMQARFERVMAGYRERVAALAPLASDEASMDWAGCTPESPPLERDRCTSEVVG